MNRDRITHEEIEDDRYELEDGPAYQFSTSRREFVAMVGAGVVISVSAKSSTAQPSSALPRQQRSQPKLSERIHIGENGIVTVMTGKVEVGQDARTQISQATAEELGISLDRVQVVMGDTELCPNDGGTFGSQTTPRTIPQIRSAAAFARRMLIEMAAKKLNVDRSSLSVQDNHVVQQESGKKLSIAELAKDKNAAESLSGPIDAGVIVQRVQQWRILGTSPQKVEANAVVTGARQYPSDITLPGMLYGKILRPPVLGATLKTIDLEPAKAIDGVVAVHDDQFVGCAAKSSFRAEQAVGRLAKTAKWDLPDPKLQASSANLFPFLKEHSIAGGSGGRRGGRSRGANTNRGSVEDGLAKAKKKLSSNFEIAYIQHAPMEPRAAVAQWEDGKLTVWTGTQNPTRVRGELMQAFRLPTERARVIVPDTGGGFGGKHTGEVALEAARLAKETGKPVSVRWSREEEFQWAYFRPAGLIEASAGIDENNKLVAWSFKNYNSGGSSIGTPYEIANVNCQSIRCDAPLRAGSYRALAATANTFARECFMDELAHAVGADSLEFRLAHLPAGRLRSVLEIVAKRFDWAKRLQNLAPNEGLGLACGTEKASYVAACVALDVDPKSGNVKLQEVCQAFECGAIQNPANLRAQVEGCLIMGLGGAMKEEIEFADGKITNAAFSEYLVPRMSDVPKIDTVLVNRPDLESVGAGETPIIAIAPAIANATYRATGVRVRSMPIDREKLKKS